MSQNQLRRAVFAVLVLSLSLASLPVQAWAPAWERPAVIAEIGEEASFLGKLCDLLAGFWGVREKEGVTIDPDGAQGDEGVLIDPDGATGDEGEEGMSIDPDGAR
ncbi:MAG TPA: hypothetical protein VE685_05900 [Thermoanaerobaculia bacterium]|nr:hypothetical protein [Thermoanaerobaculia bacterium]